MIIENAREQNIRKGLETIFPRGGPVHTRILRNDGRGAECRLFRHYDQAVDYLLDKTNDSTVKGCYFVFNQLPDDFKPEPGGAAKDDDIRCRNWLLVDIDHQRPSDTSTTDSEKAESERVAGVVAKALADRDWGEPVWADSGNGFHLLYKLLLPKEADDAESNLALVKASLEAISKLAPDSLAHVDTTVANAARITKAYGTWARKGPNTTERPHRLSRIINVPELLVPVTARELKELCGGPIEVKQHVKRLVPSSGTEADVLELIEMYNLELGKTYTRAGKKYFTLNSCPLNGGPHTSQRTKTSLILGKSFGFKCFADQCYGKNIGDLLRYFKENFEGGGPPAGLLDRLFGGDVKATRAKRGGIEDLSDTPAPDPVTDPVAYQSHRLESSKKVEKQFEEQMLAIRRDK